jgi:uncharacterized protein YegP (UPF0339 family)
MAGKFEDYKDSAGEFRFRLKAANGQNIFSGQAYSSKAAALAGVESVKTNAAEADRFEVKESSNGKPYFVLKAANHRVIGCSETDESRAAMEKGIQSVMKNGRTAVVRATN